MPTLISRPWLKASLSASIEPNSTSLSCGVRQNFLPVVAHEITIEMEFVDEVAAGGVAAGIPIVVLVVLGHVVVIVRLRRAAPAGDGWAIQVRPGDRLPSILVVHEKRH